MGPKYELLLLILMQLAIIILLRKYYLLTLGFMFFYILINQRLFKLRILFPVIIISFLATIDARTNILSRFTNIEIFQIRNITNDNLEIVARSRINQSTLSKNPIENLQTFTEVLQQVLLPFQLFSLSLYSLFTILMVIVISFALCSQYLIMKEATNSPESIFLFAFFSTALIFEPDLGSYVRHGFVYILLTISLIGKHGKSQ